MRSLLCLLLLAAAAAPAHAGDRNELTLGSWARALRSPSANAVTGDDLAGGGLTYARDLGLRPLPGLSVWAIAGLSWAGVGGTMFQTLATDVAALGLTAGVRARYALRARAALSARLDLGGVRTRLRLEDAMGHTAGDSGWGPTAAASAGLDLLAVAGPRFSLGVRLELGYAVARSPALAATPGDGDDGDAILLPRTVAQLGHLDLGGPFFGLALLSQF